MTDDVNEIPDNLVWVSTLDNVWRCEVRRTSGAQGVLKVCREGEPPILTQLVALAYGARFGPDVSDVAQWQAMCTAVVDAEASA